MAPKSSNKPTERIRSERHVSTPGDSTSASDESPPPATSHKKKKNTADSTTSPSPKVTPTKRRVGNESSSTSNSAPQAAKQAHMNPFLPSPDRETPQTEKSSFRSSRGDIVRSSTSNEIGSKTANPNPKNVKLRPVHLPAKQRMRKESERIADGERVPHTMEEVGEGDRIVIEGKIEGQPWHQIREKYEEVTNRKVAKSTLPNRWIRLKENLGLFSEEDDQLLLRCKGELEKTFGTEIWTMIAELMKKKGGDKYAPIAVQRRFEEMKAKEAEMALDTESSAESGTSRHGKSKAPSRLTEEMETSEDEDED